MDSSDFTMLKFLANIIQLILSPAQGWEDLAEDDRMADGRRGDINIRRLYFGCFIPVSYTHLPLNSHGKVDRNALPVVLKDVSKEA